MRPNEIKRRKNANKFLTLFKRYIKNNPLRVVESEGKVCFQIDGWVYDHAERMGWVKIGENDDYIICV